MDRKKNKIGSLFSQNKACILFTGEQIQNSVLLAEDRSPDVSGQAD